jgi:hypothetical protein
MVCRSLGKGYLVLLNGLLAFIGLAVLGYTSYLLATYSAVDAVYGTKSLWTILIAGGATFGVGLWGCQAAKNHNKCMLTIYSIVLLALIVLLAGGSISILAYAGDLKVNAGKIDTKTASAPVSNFVNCSYVKCCDKPKAPLPTCSGWDNTDFCNVLPKDLRGDCDDDEAFPAYQEEVVHWLHDNMKTIGTVVIAIGGVQLLAELFTLGLLCSATPDQERRRREREAREHLVESQAVSYGTQPTGAQGVSYV